MRRLWTVAGVVALAATGLRAEIGNLTVASAASFQQGLPYAGSIGAIFCTGLHVQGVVAAEGVPLPFSLAGVTVTVEGVAAPLFAVADLGGYQQINFQVPAWSSGPVEVIVSQNGVQGSTTLAALPASAFAAGEFFRIPGTQFGVFQHASDYSLVTPENPARAGEYIIAYATGLPPTNPGAPIGQPAPMSPLSYVPQTQERESIDSTGLAINGSVALFAPGSGREVDTTGRDPVPFMGLAPGTVGLYQINFMLPAGLPQGNLPIQLVRHRCMALFQAANCSVPSSQHQYQFSQAVLIPVE